MIASAIGASPFAFNIEIGGAGGAAALANQPTRSLVAPKQCVPPGCKVVSTYPVKFPTGLRLRRVNAANRLLASAAPGASACSTPQLSKAKQTRCLFLQGKGRAPGEIFGILGVAPSAELAPAQWQCSGNAVANQWQTQTSLWARDWWAKDL